MRQAAEHVSHGFSTIGLDETQHVIPLVGERDFQFMEYDIPYSHRIPN
jgi:hypothetical protein